MKTKHIIVATLSYLSVVTLAIAQAPAPPPKVFTNQIVVMGNNSHWTKISGVEANTLIRVFADGAVKFGPRSSTDTAVAGVEGNGFFKWTQGIFGSNWEGELRGIVANPAEHIGTIKKVFGASGPVNFNQGGVWIKIVSRKTGKLVASTQLFYYWDKMLNGPGFMSDSDVDVFAKAHDGGRDPESTDSYDDNTGSYRVWLGLAKPPRVEWTLP